jgi:dTDP-glucose 4,6-dehydratase
LNVRDWLHVNDHARALTTILSKGKPGETYVVGGRAEKTNITIVKTICAICDELFPHKAPHEKLITYVADRPGHDRRYAIDPAKIERELGWTPQANFEAALRETVAWYRDNESWWRPIREGVYRGERLGLAKA